MMEEPTPICPDVEGDIIRAALPDFIKIGYVFIGLCILIFCLSIFRAKKLIKQTTQKNYRTATIFYTLTIAFMVLATLNIIGLISGWLTDFKVLYRYFDNELASQLRLMWTIETVLTVLVLILGVFTLVCFSKALSVYKRIYPPAQMPCPFCGAWNSAESERCNLCGNEMKGRYQ